MNRKSVLSLTYNILTSKEVDKRFWNTSKRNMETLEVTATLNDCINLIAELYKKETEVVDEGEVSE